MTVAEMIIAAAEKKGDAVDHDRIEAVRRLVEDAQHEFDERAARLTVTSRDLDRAYSL